jgi:hypothetical protein
MPDGHTVHDAPSVAVGGVVEESELLPNGDRLITKFRVTHVSVSDPVLLLPFSMPEGIKQYTEDILARLRHEGESDLSLTTREKRDVRTALYNGVHPDTLTLALITMRREEGR